MKSSIYRLQHDNMVIVIHTFPPYLFLCLFFFLSLSLPPTLTSHVDTTPTTTARNEVTQTKAERCTKLAHA